MPVTVTLPPLDTAVVVAGMPLVVVDVEPEDGAVVDVEEPPVVVDDPLGDVVAVEDDETTVDVDDPLVVVDGVVPPPGSSAGSDVGVVAPISGVKGWSETWSPAAPTTCQAMAVVSPVATIQATMSPVRVMWSSFVLFLYGGVTGSSRFPQALRSVWKPTIC
jgi:hypothetical protein